MPYVQSKQTAEQTQFMKYVNEFGSIEYNQLPKLFPKWTADELRYHTQKLYNSYKIDIQEGSVVLSYARREVDHDMVDCLWVAISSIDKIRNNMLFRAESPVSLIAQFNDGTFKEYVKIDTATLDNLFVIEERYFTRNVESEGGRGLQYVLICDNENVLKSIEEYGFQAPFLTALLRFDENGQPIITGSYTSEMLIEG